MPPTWPQQPPPPPGPWQPPGQQPYGYYSRPERSTNGLAIAALVTAFNVAPVSIGLSIGALVQLRKRDQAGKGLAIAALVVSSLFTLAFGGILAAALSGAFDYPIGHLGSVSQAGATEVGSCLRSTDGGRSIQVPCSRGHDQEVFAVAKLPGEGFPGSARVDDLAQGACITSFRPYVGEPWGESPYHFAWYAADRDEWAGGEQRVVCVVVEGDAVGLEGSVRSRPGTP